MIVIDKVDKSFGKQKVLDNINLQINSGDRIILSGQNGAGKTTLIRCILGEYHLDNGFIYINGESPTNDRVKALRDIAFVPQTPPPLRVTVAELIDYTSTIKNYNRDDVNKYSEHLEFDIKANMQKQFYKLSGGMKQKLLISVAFASNPKIFIFDEPTANLDKHGRNIFKLLLDKHSKEETFIFISHRIEELVNIVNRAVELEMGRILSDEKI